MAIITVGRQSPGGDKLTLTFDDVSELERAAAEWSWSPDMTTEIWSNVLGEGELVSALPHLGSGMDEPNDARQLVELPLGDQGEVRASLTVQGNTWVLLTGVGEAWVPVPFWEYSALRTLYELSIHTERGAGVSERVYTAPHVIVTISLSSHFNARVDGDEELSVEAGEFDGDPTTWALAAAESAAATLLDPVPDDPLESVQLTVPALDATELPAFAERLKAAFGSHIDMMVNNVQC